MAAFLFRARPAQAVSATSPQTLGAPRGQFVDVLHLFVLTTFAITQPMYDRLGESPVFLVDSGFGIPGVLLLSAVLSLAIPAVPALMLWGIGRLAPRARFAFHAIATFVLLAIILLPVAKRGDEVLPAGYVIGLALATAACATWCYFAFRRVRTVATLAAAGIVAFPAWFLWHSPVTAVVGGSGKKLEYASGNPIPIVMIVLDELCGMELVNEKHEIDAARFPNFAELARGSTWYRNATTVYPDTWMALPVLLSGQFPSVQYSPRPQELPQNLFSIFESTGAYDFAVFEPISRLASHRVALAENTPRSAPAQVASVAPTLSRVFVQHLAPAELQRRLPGIPALWFGIGDASRVDRQARRGVFRYRWGEDRRTQFEHFIDCLEDSAAPTLYFFHVLLPHVPWNYLPTGRRYMAESNQFELLNFDTYSGKFNVWGADELYVTQSQQRQLLQLQFTDALLGRTLARLRETGLYDKCLLIVTADHGISFKINDDRRAITRGNLADIMSVPLFIKAPGQQNGAVSEKNVESIDILPTIVDVLKIDLPLPVEGTSVFDSTLPDRQGKTIYAMLGERRAAPADVLEGSTTSAELRSRLGPSDDPQALFRIGPHPELLGRSPRDLPAGSGPAVEIELIRSETRYSKNRDDLVPCYHEGWVVSPLSRDQPVNIAVAVNGVIRAVTRTFQIDGVRDRWAAMTPENSLRPGENEIKFYSVTQGPAGAQLQECVIRPAGTREANRKRR